MKAVTTLFVLFLLAVSPAWTQTRQVVAEDSKLTVSGTSTLHDWTIDAERLEGKAKVALVNKVLELEALQFQVPVRSLKSGKGAMDSNTYDALEAKKHPTIQYQLTDVLDMQEQADGYKIKAKGKLTIAGTTRPVVMQVNAKLQDGVQFSGSIPLKMTDFNIDPPTALLGSIKTGDAITVAFNVNYQ